MSYDTMVDPNALWWGDEKLRAEDGAFAAQIAEGIHEQLVEREQDTVRSDDGAREFRVQVAVTLVPIEQCPECKGTGSIGVVVRLGGVGEEDVRCPKCNGEGRV